MKKRKAGPVKVVKGTSGEVKIYEATGGGFTLSYYVGTARKLEKRVKLDDAESRARDILDGFKTGTQHIRQFSARDVAVIDSAMESLQESKVLLSTACREYAEAFKILGGVGSIAAAARHYVDFLADQKRKATLPEILFPDLVEKFKEDIKERKKSRRYTLDMQARLAKAAEVFRCYVADIRTEQIDLWLKSMKGTSGRTKNNYRAALLTALGFAKKKGYLPKNQPLAAEDSTRYEDAGGDIGIYRPAQLATLLCNIESRMVPFVAIAAFAGIRSAEITRLDWENVRWDQGYIEIGKNKAKTRGRRLVPILPALRAWLEDHRKTSGPVLEGVQDEFALATQFKKAVDAIVDANKKPLVKIVHNGFRHSFITYRMAVKKNEQEVALEAGNSPKMIFENYRELATEADGLEWFSTIPLVDQGKGKVIVLAAKAA